MRRSPPFDGDVRAAENKSSSFASSIQPAESCCLCMCNSSVTRVITGVIAVGLAADAELFGTHVPRPGPGQGLQHQPHHAQAMAGEARTACSATRFLRASDHLPPVPLSPKLCIHDNYKNNPFHNFRHCFCVTQMMYSMICLCSLQVSSALR